MTAPTQSPETVAEDDPTLARLRESAHLVAIASTHGPVKGACLSRSLTLWWLLRHTGTITDLCIGVSNDQGTFGAHAWLEYHGQVVNDSTESIARFAAFDKPLRPLPNERR